MKTRKQILKIGRERSGKKVEKYIRQCLKHDTCPECGAPVNTRIGGARGTLWYSCTECQYTNSVYLPYDDFVLSTWIKRKWFILFKNEKIKKELKDLGFIKTKVKMKK